MLELHQRNAWKTSGRGAQFMRGGALWGDGERDPAELPIHITGIARGCADGDKPTQDAAAGPYGANLDLAALAAALAKLSPEQRAILLRSIDPIK